MYDREEIEWATEKDFPGGTRTPLPMQGMLETWVRSLGWEEPLKKGKATTPVFWPGEFHGLYSSWGLKQSDTTERLSHTPFLPTWNIYLYPVYMQRHL